MRTKMFAMVIAVCMSVKQLEIATDKSQGPIRSDLAVEKNWKPVR